MHNPIKKKCQKSDDLSADFSGLHKQDIIKQIQQSVVETGRTPLVTSLSTFNTKYFPCCNIHCYRTVSAGNSNPRR